MCITYYIRVLESAIRSFSEGWSRLVEAIVLSEVEGMLESSTHKFSIVNLFF